MASTTRVQLFQLGQLASARGHLGPAHSRATTTQMEVAANVAAELTSYTSRLEKCVICVEDRLGPDGQRKHAPRLAGGATVLCLMHNLLYGGAHLSDNARELRSLRYYLVFHNDCGALRLLLPIVRRLADVDAEGYRLISSLGLPTPMSARKAIAKWASKIPQNYSDPEVAMQIANEVEQIVGEHNPVLAVVDTRDGEAFVAGPQLSAETGGLLAFAFAPWAAVRAAQGMTVAREQQEVAALLGQAFTAEVLLELGGADLVLGVH